MANISTALECSGMDTLNNTDCGKSAYESSWQMTGILIMEKYVFVSIFASGWLFNILSIITLQTRTYRGTSSGFLMTALACTDIGVVSTTSARNWISKLLHYDIRLYSSMACKWQSFFTYLFVHLSAWTLTLVTVERVVRVCNPLRGKYIFSLKRTIITWVILTVILFVIDSNLLWVKDISNGGKGVCMHTTSYPNYWKIWNPIDLIISSAAPFAIILPCNILIIITIIKNVTKMHGSSNGGTNSSGTSSRGTNSSGWSSRGTNSRGTRSRGTNSSGTIISSTTVMLIVNSIAFVVLTAPAAIELTLISNDQVDFENPTALFLLVLFHVLFSLNSSVNFVLYSVSGSKFRREFLSFCRNKCNAHNFFTVSTRYNSDSENSNMALTTV